MSCFDIAFLVGENQGENSTTIPNEKDFRICLMETKNGEPHPDTGIPPSFLVIKWEKAVGKNPQMNIDLGRPTKLYVSLSRLEKLISIRTKVRLTR